MTMPRHERAAVLFLARHVAYGLVGALTFLIGLVVTDVGGLGSLALSSDQGWLSLLLLFDGLFVTFGGVAFGIGVMTLGEDRY